MCIKVLAGNNLWLAREQEAEAIDYRGTLQKYLFFIFGIYNRCSKKMEQNKTSSLSLVGEIM